MQNYTYQNSNEENSKPNRRKNPYIYQIIVLDLEKIVKLYQKS